MGNKTGNKNHINMLDPATPNVSIMPSIHVVFDIEIFRSKKIVAERIIPRITAHSKALFMKSANRGGDWIVLSVL